MKQEIAKLNSEVETIKNTLVTKIDTEEKTVKI